MSRTLTGALDAALQADPVRPVLITRIETAGGVVRAWSGTGDLVWGGETYAGVGIFGGVSEVKETSDIEATGIRYSLSGLDQATLSLALNSIRQGKPAKLWVGALNISTGALISDPVLIHEGTTDVPEIDDGGASSTIQISAEHELLELERAIERRYTHEDQALIDSTDRGFEFVPSLQDKEIVFGR